MALFTFLGVQVTKGLLAQLAVAAGSVAYSAHTARQIRNKAERQAVENAFGNIRDTASGAVLGEPYGYVALPGHHVWHRRFSDMRDIADQLVASSGATEVGRSLRGNGTSTIGGLDDVTHQAGQTNQYLAFQDALCVGGLDVFTNILYDERSGRTTGAGVSGHAIAEPKGPGETSAPVTTTDGSRASAKFTDMAHVNYWLKFEPDDPRWYGRIPDTVVFGQAKQIRTLSGGAFGPEARTRNLAAAAAHLRTKSKIGRQRPDSNIHFESYQASYDIANEIVVGPNAPAADTAVPDHSETFNQYDIPVPTTFANYNDDRGIWDRIRNRSNPNGNAEYRRYEVNGLLMSDLTEREQLDQMLTAAPGAVDFTDFDGEHHLVLPDSKRSEAAQSVATLQSEIIGDIDVVWPGVDERFNQVVVNYLDVARDFAQETITFPKPGSATHTKLLALDSGVPSVAVIDAPMIATSYHANSAAANELLLSRREKYSFKAQYSAMNYSPGDVVRLVRPKQNIDVYVKILDHWKPEGAGLRFIAARFSKDDTAWIPDPEGEINPLAPPGRDALPTPADVMAELSGRNVVLTFDVETASLLEVVHFELGIKRDADEADSPWEELDLIGRTATGTMDANSQFSKVVPVTTEAQELQFRVRAIGRNSGVGAWAESNVLTVTALDLVPNQGIAVIYKRSATLPGSNDRPTGNATYTFATNTTALDSADANGWSTTEPAGSDTLYIRTAPVLGSMATAAIAPDDWGPPVGGGQAGADGVSFGLVRLWTTTDTATPPAAATLPSSVTWRFVPPGVSSGLPTANIWKDNVADAGFAVGKYVWLAIAAAAGTASTVAVARASFAIVLDSRIGQDGNGQESIFRVGTLADLAAFQADRTGWAGLPNNNFPYEMPTDPWKDEREAVETTESNPVLFWGRRRTPGTPDEGDPSVNAMGDLLAGWGAWAVSGIFLHGRDGAPGRAGLNWTSDETIDSYTDWDAVETASTITWAVTTTDLALIAYLTQEIQTGDVLNLYWNSGQWVDFIITSKSLSGGRIRYGVLFSESMEAVSTFPGTAVRVGLSRAPSPIVSIPVDAYLVSDSEPTTNPGAVTYRLSSGAPTSNLQNSWTDAPPGTNSNVWRRSGLVQGRAVNDLSVGSIAAGDWGSPVQVRFAVEDGEDGDPGMNVTATIQTRANFDSDGLAMGDLVFIREN